MSSLPPVLQVIALIGIVLMIFNVIIFVHELGHFLAARWRGLRVDRFQIWFGKPIWKTTYNGVQYGLGWIPAGGFVALPQMATMEAIEGDNLGRAPLPPIKPLDKIIVAAAGPLFSILLALAAAVGVWAVGKPKDFIETTTIGFVLPDSPAEKAGLRIGDTITAINGRPVDGFQGSLDSVVERIILSRGDAIAFTVERPGETGPVTLESGFETGESRWYQRRATRQVGIAPSGRTVVDSVTPGGPAEKAGIVPGDEFVTLDGEPVMSYARFSQYVQSKGGETLRIGVRGKGGELREVTVTPVKPIRPEGKPPMLGIGFDGTVDVDVRIVHPKPLAQICESAQMMWITISSVAAPNSNIGIDHLSGPVGIAKLQYQLLQTEEGWRRILSFMVLFNVNLAILNMLPFPVLDGGHITLALLEKIAGRPVKARPLEIIQTFCVLALMSLMLYVTSKDIGDGFGRGPAKAEKIEFAE